MRKMIHMFGHLKQKTDVEHIHLPKNVHELL